MIRVGKVSLGRRRANRRVVSSEYNAPDPRRPIPGISEFETGY